MNPVVFGVMWGLMAAGLFVTLVKIADGIGWLHRESKRYRRFRETEQEWAHAKKEMSRKASQWSADPMSKIRFTLNRMDRR